MCISFYPCLTLALGCFSGAAVHTRWNCLVSRRVNDIEVVPTHLTINGKLAPPIPPHLL